MTKNELTEKIRINSGLTKRESADILDTVFGIMKETLHPYTFGLIKSIPDIGVRTQRRLIPISGSVPSPFNLPEGCSFQPRCERGFEKCTIEPPLFEKDNNHRVRCWLYE